MSFFISSMMKYEAMVGFEDLKRMAINTIPRPSVVLRTKSSLAFDITQDALFNRESRESYVRE